MSSTTTKLLHDRLLADQDVLARIGRRLDTVHRAHTEAQERLLDAQRAAEVLASEARELQSAKQTLAKSLATTRCALLREYVARLPDDIWRCVFDKSVREERGSRIAFILARVCTRWRRIILFTPYLWSRIRFCASNAISAKLLEAAKLMLSRSGAGLLSLSIWFETRPDDEPRMRIIRDIISAVSEQVHRWSVVTLMLPEQTGHGPLAVLKGPTPKLVSLVVMLYTLGEDSGYLPYAPMLESLTLTHTGMACSAFSTYPALTNASIICDSYRSGAPSHLAYGFLSRARGSLEKIKIDAFVEHSARAADPLLLPQLRTLVLEASFGAPSRSDAVPAVTLLATPRLTHIHLDMFCEILPALPVSFLAAVSSTVRTMTFFRALTADALERLRHLQNIERVEFGASIDEAAYTALTTHVPPIWPRLTIMDMRRPSKNCGDALIKLVASRNLAQAERGARSESAGPCRLCEVILGPEAPRWVSAEVQRLLAL